MAAQYGYIRVSGADQNEARQVIAMREAGLDGNHIYMRLNLRRFSLLHGTMRTEHVLDLIFCSLRRPP